MELTVVERRVGLPAAIRLAGFTSAGQWADSVGISESTAYKIGRGEPVVAEIQQRVDDFIILTCIGFADSLRQRNADVVRAALELRVANPAVELVI